RHTRFSRDWSSDVCSSDLRIDLTNLAAGPLLAAAADFDRLVGTVNGRIAVAASGNSQRDIVQTLNGDGALLFSDGAIRGINIAEIGRASCRERMKNVAEDG